eukprot:TRINITY_DN432_c0_g1_i17.p1 TRINITY_DN432_c0_g1~~TRINITY_DN432_c0_g1_i17.p1  ORF type:complete len:443 (+),score=104.68 TRINITY_DN432_c0_g1_i17:3511-4839(+)
MMFLSGHGFDFNKWVKLGIPYVSREKEAELRKKLQRKKDNSKGRSNQIFLKPFHIKYLNNIYDKIDEWLQSGEGNELELKPSSPFFRKLTYQELEKKYPTLIAETHSLPDGKRCIKLLKANESERKKKEKSKDEKREQELLDRVGFRAVIDMIAKHKKLIIGHNCFLDFLHMYYHFYGTPAESLKEFKTEFNSIFPLIMDTKHIAQSEAIWPLIYKFGTRLNDLFNACLELDDFDIGVLDIPEKFNRYSSDSESVYHEAGYDALITGQIFIALINYLGPGNINDIVSLLDHPDISKYKNKLHLFAMEQQSYVDICGEDNTPLHDNVFHITFDSEYKSRAIIDIFQVHGKCYLKWISDTTCYLIFKDLHGLVTPEICDKIIRTYPEEFEVCTFAHYSSNKDNPETVLGKRKLDETEGIHLEKPAKRRKIEDSQFPEWNPCSIL